ncbi:GH1 family beta-glucosidase [Anaerocolumna sp. MB42-C2]|uniref:GH1 family beta-glucosidase n=1 Tax=Anaerocolumna sp. MB42-C2 TaxID=3070997 RepID=UPI0027E032A0|nr:GH1 family beta-glucosidase [Anaerocolumna sp. MB42-C2]WMJ89553.1 GH1 family beta-glucosidase [Anaerocolumna sp. MB42-C2]
MSFPKDFAWGAATAAYQIEGGAGEDGRGPSIWDTYAHNKKIDLLRNRMNILNGDTGDTACDHYHRYKEDVQHMKEMGLLAYRFSISWSRILPEGRGKVNEKGLKFYSDLVDELIAAGIEPYITLFHWDLPQALQDIGGWLNPEMPDLFGKYVKVVVDALSDRVTYWMTLNEPQCHIIIGHIDGECAPKQRVTDRQGFYLIHSILKAHGKAVRIIRKYAVKKPQIGIAPNPSAYYPSTDRKEDVQAAKKMAFGITSRNFWCSTWWLDPIFLGCYPEDGIHIFGDDFPLEMIKPGDMEMISEPIDFLGCNFYQGTEIRADKSGEPVIVPRKPGFDMTAFKWGVTPQILHYMPNFLYNRYQIPIYITENGLSMADWVSLDGKVHDPQRIDFMQRYLLELKKAIDDGTPVKGYFAWSMMDNYEWSNGYTERFGMIHVDYETQKRTLKDSAYWYHDVIKSNGKSLLIE